MQNRTKKFLKIICMMICIVVMAIQPVFADTTSSPVTVKKEQKKFKKVLTR